MVFPFWASGCLLQQAVDCLNDGRLRAVGRLVGRFELHAEDGKTHGVQGQVQVETLHVHHLAVVAAWTCVYIYIYIYIYIPVVPKAVAEVSKIGNL